jgi:mycothiol synthase
MPGTYARAAVVDRVLLAQHARRMGDLRLRTSTADDVAAMVDVQRRAFRRLTGREHASTVESTAARRTSAGRDPERDTVVVVDDSAVVVAFGSFFARPPFSQLYIDHVVDPDLDDDHHGAAVRLVLDHGLIRCAEVLAGLPADPRRTLATDIVSTDERGARVLDGLGWAVSAHDLVMEIDLTSTPVPPTRIPPGIAVRPTTDGDGHLVGEVLREAFLDHRGDAPFTPELGVEMLARPHHLHAVSAVASDVAGPVAAIVCSARPAFGHVDVLGVLRRGRGRGVASALLTHAFHGFADRGTTTVTLEVDADSLTGATRVYERAGMRAVVVQDEWARRIVGV